MLADSRTQFYLTVSDLQSHAVVYGAYMAVAVVMHSILIVSILLSDNTRSSDLPRQRIYRKIDYNASLRPLWPIVSFVLVASRIVVGSLRYLSSLFMG